MASGEPPVEVLAIAGRQDTEGVKALCVLWIESQMGGSPGDNLKMEIVEGADRNWSGYYDKIAGATGKWLSQQPRCEVQPPSESASTVATDQTPSVPVMAHTDQTPSAPVVAHTVRARFSGQVL